MYLHPAIMIIASTFPEHHPVLSKSGLTFHFILLVDRFSKYAHFTALGHPYSAASVARAFFDNIVCLYGIPSPIISDCDPIFTSGFWSNCSILLTSSFN